MQTKEQRQFWHNQHLDIGLFHGFHREFAYPRHSHDHYVICLVERGVQSFTHLGIKHITPPKGLIMINPGAVHTGEPATEAGFQLRSLYPTVSQMQMVAGELTGRNGITPHFRNVRVDDDETMRGLVQLHETLKRDEDQLESESLFVATFARLIDLYADLDQPQCCLGRERKAVRRTRDYIESHFDQTISLNELAAQAALSPYYLLRVFSAEVGMPPHAYLQDVRIRRAQALIHQGESLSDVSMAVGFSSQSHMTRRFKQIVGIAPGRYAKQIAC